LHRRRTILTRLALSAAVLSGSDEASAQPSSGLSPEARSAASAATLAYRDAWLANRPDAVMATLSPDAVLLPSGLEPISGAAAIRAFWWPEGGPAATITAMEQTIDEVTGAGGVAIVRGHGSLTFSLRQNGREETRSQRSTFLNVVRRQPDGRWLITHRMWSDRK
jgi:ketosteroid isomerase-like protein